MKPKQGLPLLAVILAFVGAFITTDQFSVWLFVAIAVVSLVIFVREDTGSKV